MADDIDIEEHDVLQNPAIRNIFPDISVIKKEISDYFEDAPLIKQEPELAVPEKKKPSVPLAIRIKADEDANLSTNSEIVQENSNDSSQSTKIILGSKSNKSAEKDTQNVKKTSCVAKKHTSKTNLESAKIILGSKPAQQVKDSDNNTKNNVSAKLSGGIPTVILQDIGEFIYQSKRYCKDCKTVFPTRSEFEEHKNIHSLKSVKDCNKIKTRNHKLNIKVLLAQRRAKYTHKCPICGLCFGTVFRLSQHHRNIHETKCLKSKEKKEYKCSLCESSFTQICNLKRHIRLYHKKGVPSSMHNNDSHVDLDDNENASKEKLKKLKSVTTPHKCTICGSHFCSIYSLIRHYKNVHKKNVTVQQVSHANPSKNPNDSSFNPHNKSIRPNRETDTLKSCFHCDEKFPDQNSLINHIYEILGSNKKPDIQKHSNEPNESKTSDLKDKQNEMKKDESNKTASSISFKEKLAFEADYQDERASSTSEKGRKVNINCKENEGRNSLDEEHAENISSSDEEFLGTISESSDLAAPCPRALRNKRKYERLNPKSEILKNKDRKENEEGSSLNEDHVENVSSSDEEFLGTVLESSDLAVPCPRALRNKKKYEPLNTEKELLKNKDCKQNEGGSSLDEDHIENVSSSDEEFLGTISEYSDLAAPCPKAFRNKRKYEPLKPEKEQLKNKDGKQNEGGSSLDEDHVENVSGSDEEILGIISVTSDQAAPCPRALKSNKKYEPLNLTQTVSNSIKLSENRHQQVNKYEDKNKIHPSSVTKQVNNHAKCKSKKTIKLTSEPRSQIDSDSTNKETKSKNLKRSLKTKKIIKKKKKKCNEEAEANGVYECIYCSYILPSLRAYCAHIIDRHKVVNISRGFKVAFEKKCKYCPSLSNNTSTRNTHVYRYHHDLLTKSFFDESEAREWEEGLPTLFHSEFKKVKSFVLKSIIYKCGKCDIHFLSSCVAKDHQKHMELLVNWKCSICKNIFKKHDKHLHLKQHTFSKTLDVCEFNETELSRLLYNCTKCSIHFTEESYLVHYVKCGIQTTDSVYCKRCDILIDKRGFASHESFHKLGSSTDDFIVMTGDLITASKNQDEVPKKRKRLYEQVNCLTFCDSCKCYLSDVAIGRKAHIQRTCFKMVKYTCKLCGLVFTNKSINTHRDHHKKQKNLKVQDFKFFDLKGIQIRPPIPDYPRCENCDITFVHKSTVSSHICSEMEYVVCEICKVKFTEIAFQLHMNFHTYCMPNEKKSHSLDKPTNSQEQCDYKTMQKRDVKKLAAKETASDKRDNIEIIKPESKCHNMLETTKTERSDCNISCEDERAKGKDNESSQVDSNIIYTCQSCEIAMASYDKVIEHCYNHFSPTKAIAFKMCTSCLLKFEEDSYEKHQDYHQNTIKMQYLTFDPTYFTADGKIWRQHVFASVKPSQIKEIMNQSIYPPECKIKMDIIQRGPSHLTVYKCNRCNNFIDSDFLIEHLREMCHKKVRKYPCSICGLPLFSTEFRTKHERIHEQYNNIRLKSYNIAVFNCAVYKTINDSIISAMMGKYVLYQCRSCDGIVDKEQRQDHKCNIEDLQKCGDCGLILYKKDFERHISKHIELPLYKVDNMRAVLFGTNENDDEDRKLISSFKGTICDYKLYKCESCEVCVNDQKSVSRHVCVIDDSKWKCPRCGFYICARSIKHHIKLHDHDAELKKDNIDIIPFTKDKTNIESNSTKCDSSEQEKNDTQLKDQCNNVPNSSEDKTQDEELATLYKCACGLHFVTETNAKDHADDCFPNMKIARQNCSKCSLVFNPKELFAHIIAHHSDKSKTFKYNIVIVSASDQ